MYVTDEVETADKWCPFSRLSVNIEGLVSTGNRFDLETKVGERAFRETTCIGSHCMAWRWARDGDHGYCGLAGKPNEDEPGSEFAA